MTDKQCRNAFEKWMKEARESGIRPWYPMPETIWQAACESLIEAMYCLKEPETLLGRERLVFAVAIQECVSIIRAHAPSRSNDLRSPGLTDAKRQEEAKEHGVKVSGAAPTHNAGGGDDDVYRRDWTNETTHENGNYSNKCMVCGNYFMGYKDRVVCKLCADNAGAVDKRVAATIRAMRLQHDRDGLHEMWWIEFLEAALSAAPSLDKEIVSLGKCAEALHDGDFDTATECTKAVLDSAIKQGARITYED